MSFSLPRFPVHPARLLLLAAVLCGLAAVPFGSARAEGEGPVQLEREVAPPAEGEAGYRPRWADPNAAPAQPGIENDPTPFNPADVDSNSDQMNNNISPLGND